MDATKTIDALKRTIEIIEKMDGSSLTAIAVIAPPNGSVVEIVTFGTDTSNEDFATNVAHSLGRAMQADTAVGAFVGMPSMSGRR